MATWRLDTDEAMDELVASLPPFTAEEAAAVGRIAAQIDARIAAENDSAA